MAWKECTMEQLHFRTDRVAPGQRFEHWRQALFDTYYRLDCHADDPRMASAPFRGVLESRVHGGVRCSRIASSPNRVVRTHGQVRGGEADELGLLVIAGGTLSVDHCGRHALLQPGDLLAFDNARDYVFDLRSDYDLLCFQLPRELLPQRGSPLERHLGARLPGRNAATGVLRAYASTLAQRLDEIAEPRAVDFLRQLGELLKLACGGSDASPDAEVVAQRGSPSAALWRVRCWIEAHLASPDMCPEQIARSNAMSVRALHQLFHGQGTSVMQAVREARLARGHEQLLARGATGKTVEQVAFAAGFRDPSHFRRAYRARYGVAPSKQ
jgi:AraC-like DNA-binding protein